VFSRVSRRFHDILKLNPRYCILPFASLSIGTAENEQKTVYQSVQGSSTKMTAKQIEKNAKWDDNWNKIKKKQAKHRGSLSPTALYYTGSSNKAYLYNWLRLQRKKLHSGNLSAEQENKLRELDNYESNGDENDDDETNDDDEDDETKETINDDAETKDTINDDDEEDDDEEDDAAETKETINDDDEEDDDAETKDTINDDDEVDDDDVEDDAAETKETINDDDEEDDAAETKDTINDDDEVDDDDVEDDAAETKETINDDDEEDDAAETKDTINDDDEVDDDDEEDDAAETKETINDNDEEDDAAETLDSLLGDSEFEGQQGPEWPIGATGNGEPLVTRPSYGKRPVGGWAFDDIIPGEPLYDRGNNWQIAERSYQKNIEELACMTDIIAEYLGSASMTSASLWKRIKR
jgi:hypothetical protein